MQSHNVFHQGMALKAVAVFTLVQIVLVFLLGYTPYPDSNGYIALAEAANAAGEPYPVTADMNALAFLWNVGAINMTQLSLTLFGSATPLLVLYALMKGATAFCFYLLVKELADAKTATVALVLYLLYPANYGEATSLLSELPFLFFAMAACLVAVRRYALLAGVLLAVANWFRPMGLVFIVALIACFLILYGKAVSGKRQVSLFLRKTAGLVAGFALMASVIGGVNYVRTGRFFYQAATGWMALMQYSWDHDSDTVPDRDFFEGGNPNVLSETHQYDVLKKDSAWRSHFGVWLSHNTGEYLSQMPEKLVRTYISDNTTFCAFLPESEKNEQMYERLSMETLSREFPHYSTVQWLTVVNLLYYYLLLVGAAVGLVRCLHLRRYALVALAAGVIITGTAVLLIFGHGETRFHIPFMPFFILLCAHCTRKAG